MQQPVGEFSHIDLAADVSLHCHRLPLFKTVRVDLCISEQMRPQRNSRLALIGRLLERGTRDLPDSQSLNRFVDDLYGAHYYAEIDRLGDFQYIHLGLEVVDQQLLAGDAPDVLARGMAFLNQVLCAPAGDGLGFRADYLAQEKRVLGEIIEDRFNDKMAYAQHRCVEEMCRGEAIALSPLGGVGDFAGIGADDLLQCHRDILAGNRLDLFISGDVDESRARALAADLITWERVPQAPIVARRPERKGGAGREVFELQDVQQATLVVGYRAQVAYGHADYPALVLLNLVLGGEGTSRLFRSLREEEGLCYYVASHIEPLSGLLFVVAGIGADGYGRARAGIERQLEGLRQGRIEEAEVEVARKILRAHLMGLGEDRDAHFRYRFREALVGGGIPLEVLGEAVGRVGREELARVARGLAVDTSYLLHGGLRAGIAV